MVGGQLVQVDGRRLRISSLDKVLYPETGTTKGEVIDYYSRIAPYMLPHLGRRPITRKRWVDGVGTPAEPRESFFVKELEAGAPDWVARGRLQHSSGITDYPLALERATLVHLAQLASLELHVPQWQFAPDGTAQPPDRLVLDLDPGPGVGLPECAHVAGLARNILDDIGLSPIPVTSGSKGIHLYARLNGEQTSEQVSAVARELARALEADHPSLITSAMTKALRPGKVFIDWSQNNGKKTTIAPYSLRGTPHPTVAAPRTWEELAAPGLRHLLFDEVLERAASMGDPLQPLAGHGALARYIAMRTAGATPEPVPTSSQPDPRAQGMSFVIQEHHATRLHWDLRLERGGVLVSWAVPKGVPATSDVNHLAIQTEDHPLDYGSFEGTIPTGEYGAGEVTIWDSGSYELEKWRDDEIIFTLDGWRQGRVRLVLIRTEGEGEKAQWILRRMKHDAGGAPQAPADAGVVGGEAAMAAHPDRPVAVAPEPAAPAPANYAPMLATMGDQNRAHALARRAGETWAEFKWDGVRAMATWRDGAWNLRARSGTDITARYPELTEEARPDVGSVVLDGEIVALDTKGRPDFGRLQHRMHLADPTEIAQLRRRIPVRYYVFDVLEVDGHPVVERPLWERRELLERVAGELGPVLSVPPVFDDIDATLAAAREHHLEGLIVKDPGSKYRPGRRSESWLKVKLTQSVDVVIGGLRRGDGARAATFSSLLLGVPEDSGLRYVGRVGTGFSNRELHRLTELLEPLIAEESPFLEVAPLDARDAVWVRPELRAEVEFAEWTTNGSLRQARWRGLK